MNTMHEEHTKEILQRAIRIETRLTAYLESIGAPVNNMKPMWNSKTSAVDIPSMDCSIGQIMATIPAGYKGDVYLDNIKTGKTILIGELL